MSSATAYELLITACWLVGGIGLCILAAALIELYATAPLPPDEPESEHDPSV